MADKSWKAFERRCAKKLGGQRRGPDTTDRSDGGTGKSDIVHDHYAPECKLLSRPSYGDIVSACLQAERNAGPNREPIAIVKRKSAHDADALVVMRLSTFCEWRV